MIEKTYIADNGCIIFTGSRGRYGHGEVRQGDKKLYAHRVAWEYHRGPIPEDMTVDHLCGNGSCVNVEHMEIVTRGENTIRMLDKNYDLVCKRGHFDDWGYQKSDGYPSRYCKSCMRERLRKRREGDANG